MTQPTNTDQPAYLDTTRRFAERAQDLIARLTLPEKVGLMSHPAKGVPRLGIPATGCTGHPDAHLPICMRAGNSSWRPPA